MTTSAKILRSASGLPFAPAGPDYKNVTHTIFTAGTLGLAPRILSIEQFALALPADGTVVTVFESFGYVNGRHMFTTRRVRRFDRGVEVLRPNGDTLLIHPFGRGRQITFLDR